MMQHHQTGKIRKAFTLIEMLVVLLIIGLLAAILFPVLTSAKEKGYQASCATGLHQIYLAVALYKNDEGGYPASLGDLLPNTDDLASYTSLTAGTPSLNSGGKGYFKGGNDALICADDDTLQITDGSGKNLTRSSYGDTSTDTTAGPQDDFGRFVWNYWGYRAKADTSPCSATDVSGCMGTEYKTSELKPYGSTFLADGYVAIFSAAAQNRFWVDPTAAYDITNNPIDITKLPRLANRYAPPDTIITHCVYHRLPTSNTDAAYDIYNADGSGNGAKDIILRLDGTAKVLDVTTDTFVNQEGWTLQRF
jgi:prepilin-type N-terminal cleavage/methylation domain-containing protein